MQRTPSSPSRLQPLRGLVLDLQNNDSLRNEIQHAIDRGLAWLTANQNSTAGGRHQIIRVTPSPSPTFNGDPMDRYRGKEPAYLRRAYGFILNQARPDGSICVTNLPTYNTSLSMMALLTANNPQYDPVLRKAPGVSHWGST